VFEPSVYKPIADTSDETDLVAIEGEPPLEALVGMFRRTTVD
jgi:hypothetical protein